MATIFFIFKCSVSRYFLPFSPQIQCDIKFFTFTFQIQCDKKIFTINNSFDLQHPGSIAAMHGRRILQGDQLLEINGQNVRDSNQKEVAALLRESDGAIVLLLGRVASLTSQIQEWARKKAQMCLRTRTSTWSSYGGNNKEKLQTQRPSLPVNKDPVFQSTNLLSPESAEVAGVMAGQQHPLAGLSGSQGPIGSLGQIGAMEPTVVTYNAETQEVVVAAGSGFTNGISSRSSSIRSRSRLSIVAEDKKDSVDSVDDDNCSGSDNLLLPSIKVTEF